jgi:hypothetical protein
VCAVACNSLDAPKPALVQLLVHAAPAEAERQAREAAAALKEKQRKLCEPYRQKGLADEELPAGTRMRVSPQGEGKCAITAFCL